jgi:phospholipase C
MSLRRAIVFALSAAVISGCNSNGAQSPLGSFDAGGAHHRASSSPIQHIVIIMQENRSFDNFFYMYPGANYATQGAGHNGKIYPLLPINLGWAHDQNHYHWQFLEDYDKGKNDGWEDQIIQPYLSGKGCTDGNWFNEPHCWRFDPSDKDAVQPYTYVYQAQIQPYWDMANQYVLGDKTFSSNNGPTFVSHQYLVAGQSGHASEVPNQMPWGCDKPSETENYLEFGVANPPAFNKKVGHEFVGPYPCFPLNSTGPSSTYNTIANELDNAGVTWRYYVQPQSAGDSYWLNAFDAVKSIRNGPDWSNGDISLPDTNVLSDIKNNDLQQVTWVMPHKGASDHPGGASDNCGPNWVTSIVDEIGQSPYWNNTAIIVMWDEWGGWYDHVLPPQYPDPVTGAQEGLGYRIPLLIVSPYAKHGYISHKQHEIASTLHFIEQTFNLPPLGGGTGIKFADERADAFDDAFDFTKKPSAFKVIQPVDEPPVKGQPPCPKTSKQFLAQKWGPEIDY